jgi:AraC-like DNA-binding protein
MYDLVEKIKFKIELARFQKLSSCWKTENFIYSPHIIPFSRLYYPLEGEGFVSHHGKKYHLVPGKIFLIPPYSNAQVNCPEHLEKYWCHFNANILDSKLDIFSVFQLPYELDVKNQSFYIQLFRRLVEICHEPGSVTTAVQKLEAEGALSLLLAPFLDSISEKHCHKHSESLLKFSRLISYIEKNLTATLTLKGLAKEFNLNPTYLSNLFSTKMGIPLISYCNKRRIKRAIDLIRSTDYNMSEIAYKVGFSDIVNFSRTFKQHAGCSPTMYKKKYQKNKSENTPLSF